MNRRKRISEMGKETGIKKESPEIADIFLDATADTLKKGSRRAGYFYLKKYRKDAGRTPKIMNMLRQKQKIAIF